MRGREINKNRWSLFVHRSLFLKHVHPHCVLTLESSMKHRLGATTHTTHKRTDGRVSKHTNNPNTNSNKTKQNKKQTKTFCFERRSVNGQRWWGREAEEGDTEANWPDWKGLSGAGIKINSRHFPTHLKAVIVRWSWLPLTAHVIMVIGGLGSSIMVRRRGVFLDRRPRRQPGKGRAQGPCEHLLQ